MRTKTIIYLFFTTVLFYQCNNEFRRYTYNCDWVKFEREGKMQDTNSSQIAGRIIPINGMDVEELQVVFMSNSLSITKDTFQLKSDGSFEGWLSSYDSYFDVQVIHNESLLCETISQKVQGSTRYWCILRLDKQVKKKKALAKRKSLF